MYTYIHVHFFDKLLSIANMFYVWGEVIPDLLQRFGHVR